MKIGIIGLLADQANFIKAKFPSYAIEFLPREREREAAAFAQRHSKVVLMTKFISHSTQNGVPMHKRVLLSGGTTALANWLNKQASDVTIIKHTPVHKEPEVMAPATDKPTSWAPLKKLAIGETFTVKRPKHTTLTTFENNVNTQRSYYNRQHGIVTSVRFLDGSAVITVTDRKMKVSDLPPVVEHAPTIPVREPGTAWLPHLREFWQQVYVARAALGLPNDLCVNDADVAMEHARHRFG